MKSWTTATIALVAIAIAIASASAQDSHSHSSECTAEFLTSARNACDSVADISQLKCDSEACHEALHSLVEDEVRECYVELGLGPVTDLDYYVQLDEFCHGDGVDPAELTAGSNSTSSGAGAATVGDEDHDHDHDHSHDHEHEETAGSSSSSSGSNTAQSLGLSLVALQLVTLVAVGLYA